MGVEKGRLKPYDYARVQKQYVYLSEELSPDALVPDLFSKAVISKDDMEEIRNQSCRLRQAQMLVDKLLDSGPRKAYSKFLEVLKKHQPHVAKTLEDTPVTEDVGSSSGKDKKHKNESVPNEILHFIKMGYERYETTEDEEERLKVRKVQAGELRKDLQQDKEVSDTIYMKILEGEENEIKEGLNGIRMNKEEEEDLRRLEEKGKLIEQEEQKFENGKKKFKDSIEQRENDLQMIKKKMKASTKQEKEQLKQKIKEKEKQLEKEKNDYKAYLKKEKAQLKEKKKAFDADQKACLKRKSKRRWTKECSSSDSSPSKVQLKFEHVFKKIRECATNLLKGNEKGTLNK